MMQTTYYPGGYQSAATAKNKADEVDPVAATWTAWSSAGAVTGQRPLTAAESSALAAQDVPLTEASNANTLRARAKAAIDNNIAYLAITAPLNAQVLTQVTALTQQNNAIIRLLINQLNATT